MKGSMTLSSATGVIGVGHALGMAAEAIGGAPAKARLVSTDSIEPEDDMKILDRYLTTKACRV